MWLLPEQDWLRKQPPLLSWVVLDLSGKKDLFFWGFFGNVCLLLQLINLNAVACPQGLLLLLENTPAILLSTKRFGTVYLFLSYFCCGFESCSAVTERKTNTLVLLLMVRSCWFYC